MSYPTDFKEIRERAGYTNDEDVRKRKYPTDFKCIREEVSAEEWQARVDLAACYRLIDVYGMSDLIYNHITVRIPGTEHLLINLYGMTYKEITASSLMKIDVEGNIIWKPETQYGLNSAGYVIHGAIHTELRHTHAHARRNGCFGNGVRTAAGHAACNAVSWAHRLPRLRRPGCRSE
jgi:hypothetical protein